MNLIKIMKELSPFRTSSNVVGMYAVKPLREGWKEYEPTWFGNQDFEKAFHRAYDVLKEKNLLRSQMEKRLYEDDVKR